jgi:hypothetical protein
MGVFIRVRIVIIVCSFYYTVCPQSPLGVLKNCGAQTNWASHMLFAAERGSNNSREARRVDFVGLRTNDARIVFTHPWLKPGLPLLLRSWTLGNAVASLLLHSHSEVAYWTVCGNFVSLGDWFCLKKPSHTKSAFLHSRHFTNNWLRRCKDGHLFHLPASKKNFQSFAVICPNHMWLAQFVCAPQFFKTPSGLCGHTVYRFTYSRPWH